MAIVNIKYNDIVVMVLKNNDIQKYNDDKMRCISNSFLNINIPFMSYTNNSSITFKQK